MTAQTKSWRDVLKVHPAADLFPMMGEAELCGLGKNILEHGLTIPIVQSFDSADFEVPTRGMVLDGRNRPDAMECAGLQLLGPGGGDRLADWVAPRWVYPPIEPYSYVLSVKIHLRSCNMAPAASNAPSDPFCTE